MIVKLKKTKCGWRICIATRKISSDNKIYDTGYGQPVTRQRFKTKDDAIEYCKKVLNISNVHIIVPNK